MMKPHKVEFTPPQGVSTPDGVTMGDSFDMVCSFRVSGPNKVCLTKMGEVEMPGYDGKESHGSKPDYSSYVQSMQQDE